MTRVVVIWLALLGLGVESAHAASQVKVVEAHEGGLVIDVFTSLPLHSDLPITTKNMPHCRGDRGVALSMVAELVAAPPGSVLDVTVESLSTRVWEGLVLPEADASAPAHPHRLAQTIELGVLRGVDAHALQVFPADYDDRTQTLTLHDRLRVHVRFTSGHSSRPVRGGGPSSLHRAFLNPPGHDGWRTPTPARRQVGGDWYDSSLPWVKIFVDADGLYRITAARLRFFGIDPDDVDPARLRLVLTGNDQPLHVIGGEDGRFDEDDEIIFAGRYRRAPGPEGERDHESEYGPTQTYWLTWGGEQTSPRYDIVDGAPDSDFPTIKWYSHRQHFELDQSFDQLEEAPDTLSDRWFWRNDRPLIAKDPSVRSSQIFVGDVTGLLEDGDPYLARLRVSATGKTPAVVGDHHAFVTLNNEPLAEGVWSGQTAFLFDETIPSSLLADRNRVLFQAIADLSREDHIWFNWFELTFRRQFHAHPGLLNFATEPAPEGHQVTVEGFRHPAVTLVDVAHRRLFTGLVVEFEDSLYSATFEDVVGDAPDYLMVDSLSIRLPVLELDEPSDLRSHDSGAEAVIIHHAEFGQAAQRLAAHRAGDGLRVRTVSVQDVFDEYSGGQFAREPLAEFITDIYRRWTPRPVFILLMGDATWDYRGIRTGRRHQTLVPTLYYNARGRGYSPSDHLLALVDGDDLLADLVIGRLAVDDAQEADLVVDKIIRYDNEPAEGDWRSQVILAANWHGAGLFTAPSDSVYARHMAPMGLQAQRYYAPDDSDIPNVTGKQFLDGFNNGALIFNFAGHGAVATMQFLFSAQFPDWDYMSQVANGRRLPLVIALSCLNGLFSEPTTEALSEQFVELPQDGAIAFISATAESRTAQHDLLSDFLYDALLSDDPLGFGGALTWAKSRLLSVHPGFIDVPLTMQLIGDPMQRLALESDPDYVAQSIRVGAEPPQRGETTAIEVILNSAARLGQDSIRVHIVAERSAGIDTLFDASRAPFIGADTLLLSWQPEFGGTHLLRVDIDADNSTAERDETNNRLDEFIDVLVPRRPTLLWPPSGMISTDLQLEALAPLDLQSVIPKPLDVIEFALSTTPAFEDAITQTMAVSQAAGATAQLQPPAGAKFGDVLYWRARLVDGMQLGPWSETRTLRWSQETPADSVSWSQGADDLLDGSGVRLRGDALVARADTPAFRPSTPTREIGFTLLSLPGAGVLATDGTYLYAKRWFNDSSTIYPGGDTFSRVGTGFNGSIRGGDYGILTDTTTAGISATYHDGFLYSEAGMSFQIERVDPASGRLDTVNVPDGLLDWVTGRVVTEQDRLPGQVLHALITSDGEQIYNVSMSSHRGTRVGWGVRVFDVDETGDWHLQRDFVIPPTESGFTFRWTDGVVADGERLYLIEFAGERRIRMVSAEDGRFLDEWHSDQDTTRVISGQFDPVNDLIWLGDLWGSGLFGYSRASDVAAGQVVGETVGPAASWTSLQVDGDGASIEVEGRGPDNEWVSLATGTAPWNLDLASQIDAADYRFLRIRAQIGPDTTQTVRRFEMHYDPAADLELGAASADVVDGQLHVQCWVRNRGLTSSGGARLTLEQDGRVLAQTSIDPLARGESQRTLFDPILLPDLGEGLFVRLQPSTTDGRGLNDAVELVLNLPGLTTIAFFDVETGQRLQDGDAVDSTHAIRVLAPPLASGQLQLQVDGESIVADSTWTTSDGAPALLHHLSPGTHRLRSALVRDGIEFGVGELRIRVDERLRLANVLVAPHPVRSEGAFTWVLSHAARVQVDVYGVSGRRVRRLGPQLHEAGFGQLRWDRTGDDGRLVASGTYLYVVTATDRDDGKQVRRHRGGLVLLP